MVTNKSQRIASFYILIIFLLFSRCSDKDNADSYCRITFKIDTEEFYEGCIVPISINTGEYSSKAFAQLILNGEDKGLIQTSPYIYYWETNGLDTGEYILEAFYTDSENLTSSDKKIINLLPSNINCPQEVEDFDGNIYPVVKIGNQCWMQQNLKTTHYEDGDSLLNGIDSLVWGLPNELPGWYFAYEREIENVDTYAYLYTWTTAMKGNKAANSSISPIQGICPDGWHIPEKSEWLVLIDYVGGTEVAGETLKSTSKNRKTYSSTALKSSDGFSALLGGCRVSSGSYIEKEESAYFWSATETIPNHAYHVLLSNSSTKASILGHQDSKRFGYSVRCVKD